ncbi:MAG: hypothetical protein RIC19_23000 [Phaeodactylibacter sp.]|uniref:hypothetical protein n=1 Tax=Phaeodactylibacter sp. TaxID=1940289 RepID=UPI0032EAF4C3
MAKEKKIGIRFYLNDRLKPKMIAGKETFPVYCQITFNRKNIQCNVPLIYKGGTLTKQEFLQATELATLPEVANQLQLFEDKARKVIRIEYKHYKDRFTLKGFADDLYHYDSPLFVLLENQLKRAVIEFGEATETIAPDWYSLWAILEILGKEDVLQFLSSLPDDLQISLKAFVYLSGYTGREWQEDAPVTTALDWFTTPLAQHFSEFLLNHTPIVTDAQKRGLGFFKNESAKSIVWQCLFFFDVGKADIPLIIKWVSMTVIR